MRPHPGAALTRLRRIAVPDGHEWMRVTDPAWHDPVDSSYSVASGGRWNPPGTWAALYLNHDLDTARRQISRLLEGSPFLPGDLADDAYDLVAVTLPDEQTALDAVSDAGVAATGLPVTYPATATGERIAREDCWPVATRAHRAGLDGVWCRSAATLDGVGLELAWWPEGRSASWDRTRSPYGEWRGA